MLKLSLLLIMFSSNLVLGAEKLSFIDCIHEAEKNNNRLKVARYNLEAARFKVFGSRYNYFPQLSLNGSGNYGTDGIVTPAISSGTENSDSSPFAWLAGELKLTQNIFSGLADIANVEQTKINLAIVEKEYQIVAAQVSYDIKVALANVAYAQQLLLLSKNIIKRRLDALEYVRKRFNQGKENDGVVPVVESYIKHAQFEELQAAHAMQLAYNDLSLVLGYENYQQVDVDENIPTIVPENEPDYFELVKETPQYQQAEFQEKLSALQIKQARSGYFPIFDFSAAGSAQLDQQAVYGLGFLLSLEMTLPIFNGGRNYYAEKQAQKQNASAKSSKRAVMLQSERALRQLYFQAQEARQKIIVDKSFVSATKQIEISAKKQYQTGNYIFEDWLSYENDYINAEKTILQTQRDKIIADAAFEQALGKENFS